MENLTEHDIKVEEKKSFMDNVKGFGKKVVDFGKDKVNEFKEDPEEAIEKMVALGAGALLIGLTVAGCKESKKMQNSVYSEELDAFVELKSKPTNQDLVAVDYLMKHDNMTKVEAYNHLGKIK